MNLLPKSHHEFSKADYWNTFFKNRGNKAFEWYGEFLELSSYLLKYIKPNDDILIVGCGNSTLGMDLYDAGYKNIVNIDVSQVVIKQMVELNRVKRPNLIFEQMDATKMTFVDGKFSVIIDKGTLDALMPDNDKATVALIDTYLAELKRVLKNSGRYICISLLQEHILKTLVASFSSSYAFRVIRCHDAEMKAREQGESTMPVFMVVSTKFMKLLKPILELVFTEGPPIRIPTVEELVNNVTVTQDSASVCNNLYKSSVANEGEVSLDLYRPGDKEPRYTMYVLDQLKLKEKKTYAAFIVPQGREIDWLFSTKEGRQQLLKSAMFDRLIIVTLKRGQEYENLDAVKSELSASVKNFAPASLSTSQIPFLSLSGPGIGKRKICYEGKSIISGSFVVEEIESEEGLFRRLIFLDNQFVVQSEAKLKQVTSRRKKLKYVVDPDFVACEHHIYMTLGLKAALKNKDNGETVIIGLGGGGLCTFIRNYVPQAVVTAVEIDKAVLKVATEYFDLVQDAKLKVEIADGIEYLKTSSNNGKKFSAILFDVDSKDPSIGMSCPPKQFVEPDMLKTVQNCLTDDGLFILNLVARNEKLRNEVICNLQKNYKFLASYKLGEDVNEVIFCSRNERNRKEWKNLIQETATELNERAKSKNPAFAQLYEITSLLNNLKFET
ncbi:methyltransferase-like protein 13 [Copidosoma floridanum]|uniref:methyltransferase-like protein 13 n=1 Tax=Copidosoma floridanum TaxID=29053 RepID=UPI0006C982DE|nr:methyltransferase-like protein 13 [Copidosoma floridanum]